MYLFMGECPRAEKYALPGKGPDHAELAELTRNLKAAGGKAIWDLPLAASLREGRYNIEVVDVLTGARFTRNLSIR